VKREEKIIHATFKQHLSNHLIMYLWNLYV